MITLYQKQANFAMKLLRVNLTRSAGVKNRKLAVLRFQSGSEKS